MDSVQRVLTLLLILTLIGGGIFTLIAAITGSPRIYEDSKNPNMQRQLETLGKTKARILHAVGGLAFLGFGLWLLHGWLFVPQ